MGGSNKEFEDLVKIEKVDDKSLDEISVSSDQSNDKNVVINKKKKNIKIKKVIEAKKTSPKKVVKNNKILSSMKKDNQIKPVISKAEKKLDAKEVKTMESKKTSLTLKELVQRTPFRKGQKTKIEVTYLNMIAGYLELETKDIVKVNGRPSFHFYGRVWSRKLFSFIYSVENSANTFSDIEDLRPYSLEFKAKETKKIKDSKTFFDWDKKQAKYWSYKVKKGRKPSEKNKTWKLVEGSQNFVSALFFIRTFDFENQKTFEFPLADEGKNITLKAKVLGLETLNTEIGKIKAWAIKPRFEIKGSLAPIGSVKIWVRDSPGKEIVRIETKLKFGSIVGEIVPN